MSSGQKLLTRRRLLTLAGGAVGVAFAGTAMASTRRPGAAQGRGLGNDGAQKGKTAGVARTNTAGTMNMVASSQPTVTQPKPPGPVMRPLSVPAASAPVAALLGAIRPGTSLAGCKVVRVHDLHLGAIPVVLETASGQRFQLDVLRRGAVGGVADARDLSVFLANKGDGRVRTDESHGRAAMALAAALRRRRGPARLPRALLSLEQRSRRFPKGGFAVPLADA